MAVPTLLRRTLAPVVMAGALMGAPGFSKDRAVAEEPKRTNQFAAAKVETPKAERPFSDIFRTTEQPSLKLTHEEIAKADLSSIDKIVGFSIGNGFIESDSQTLRNNLLQIQEKIRLTNDKLYAPEIFAKRLTLLVKDGYLSEKQAGAILGYSSNEASTVLYHSVSYVRDLIRSLENFAKSDKPESERPRDLENNRSLITEQYIQSRVSSLLSDVVNNKVAVVTR